MLRHVRGAATAFLAFVAPAVFAASSLNVRDFGAVGDGIHDDTLAIQRAVDALYPSQKQEWGNGRDNIDLARPLGRYHVYDGATGEVFFPKGVYRVTGPVKFYWCVNVRGEKGTVVRNETRDQDTFYFHLGFRVRLDTMAFEGGYIQVRHWTQNISEAQMFVTGCTFSNAAGQALVSDSWRIDDGRPTSYDGHSMVGCSPYEISREADGRVNLKRRDPATLKGWPNSTEIVVENCRFLNNVRAFNLTSDGVFMRDCDVVANATATGAAARVGNTAHLSRVRFKTVRNPAAPDQCALSCRLTTKLTGCSFASDGPVVAVVCQGKACCSSYATRLVLKDTTCDTGDAPVLRFDEGVFPNMLVVDGLKAAGRASAAPKKVFSFVREPTDEEVSSWPKENSKGSVWGHPVIDVRKCIGVNVANVSKEFDTSLPSSLEPFRRTIPDGVRRQDGVQLSPLPEYGMEIADDAIGRDRFGEKGQDDTARVRALFERAEKAGGATIVLPPKWIRLAETIEVNGRVHVTSHGQALVTANDGGPAFRVREGSDVLFENVTFNRGSNAVCCVGGMGTLRFRHCNFYSQLAESISASCAERSKWRIELTGGVANTPFFYKGNAAPFLIDGTWQTVGQETPLGKPLKKSFASIVNLSGGVFEAQDVLGVPCYFSDKEINGVKRDQSLVGDYRWIDNYGTMRICQYRFGGEFGGLSPIHHYDGASTYVENGMVAIFGNWRLRPPRAAARVFCENPDITFVDAVGFNFKEEPPFFVVRDKSDGSSEKLPGHVYNCYPYPVPK